MGAKNWKYIAEFVPNRNHTQCLQRWGKVLAPNLVKGHWTPEEDSRLLRWFVSWLWRASSKIGVK